MSSSSKYRTGIDQIQKTAAGSGGGGRRFTPNIYWKAGDTKAIAFLTSADEIPKVKLHQMVTVPDDKMEKGFRYVDFLCRKDPSMVEESGGFCDLCDRVGVNPSEKFVALAIELDVERDGKRVKSVSVAYDRWNDKETGEERTKPRWGIVIQAAKNYFSYFAAYHENTGDIRDVPWEIYREGASTDTKYHAFELKAQLPDFSDLEIPTLEDLLEEMSSDERYAEAAGVAPGSQKVFGGGKGNKATENSGTVPSGDRDSEFERVRKQLEEGAVAEGERQPIETY